MTEKAYIVLFICVAAVAVSAIIGGCYGKRIDTARRKTAAISRVYVEIREVAPAVPALPGNRQGVIDVGPEDLKEIHVPEFVMKSCGGGRNGNRS